MRGIFIGHFTTRLRLSNLLPICLWVAAAFFSFGNSLSAKQKAEPKPVAPAKDIAPPTADLLRLNVPITAAVEGRFISALRRYADSVADQAGRSTLVIEFVVDPKSDPADTDFYNAAPIARELTGLRLNNVRTVAYLPNSVAGHAVLPALVCETLIMSRTAKLGPAGKNEKPDEIAGQVSDYAQLAKKRRNIPPLVAQAMLDGRINVVRVRTADGATDYLTPEAAAELAKKEAVVEQQPLDRTPLSFTGTEGKDWSLVNYVAGDRDQLEQALGVKIRENPSRYSDWRPIMIRLERSFSPQQLAEQEEILKKAYDNNAANFVLLIIDSDGGAAQASLSFAERLLTLDAARMRSVAWVERKAIGDAAWIALACDDLIVSPTAIIGGEGNDGIKPQEAPALITEWKTAILATRKKQWTWGAAVIGLDEPTLLHRNTQNNRLALLCETERQSLPDPDAWKPGAKVAEAGQRLALSGQRIEELQLTEITAENMQQVKEHYGLQNDPVLLEPNWADILLRALRRDEVTYVLLLVGAAAIYAELHTPGVGLGGMIALLCFMLYFWAKFLDGTSGWLEVMLFVVGLICLLIELFILPGFGIFGFGGGLMMIAALILAGQTFIIPSSGYQMGQLRNSLLMLLGAGIGLVAVVAVLQKFLPSTPGFNRMLLEPPSAEERKQTSQRESLADYEYLLGRVGKTVTRLSPAGKALIDDRLIDVVASEFLDPNTSVQVSEVRGSRVVVRPV